MKNFRTPYMPIPFPEEMNSMDGPYVSVKIAGKPYSNRHIDRRYDHA